MSAHALCWPFGTGQAGGLISEIVDHPGGNDREHGPGRQRAAQHEHAGRKYFAAIDYRIHTRNNRHSAGPAWNKSKTKVEKKYPQSPF